MTIAAAYRMTEMDVLPREENKSDDDANQPEKVFRSRGNEPHLSDLTPPDLIMRDGEDESARRTEREGIDGLWCRHRSPPFQQVDSRNRSAETVAGKWPKTPLHAFSGHIRACSRAPSNTVRSGRMVSWLVCEYRDEEETVIRRSGKLRAPDLAGLALLRAKRIADARG